MCPAPCKSTLQTALGEFGCCINNVMYYDSVNEVLLPQISGRVMTTCGLDSPGHWKSVPSLSEVGSTTAKASADWIYLYQALLTVS